jgi:hypothetical protein
MLNKSVILPALLVLSLSAAAPILAADADPTIHQVYEAAEAGRFDDAQTMMDKVLRDHPNSAKAHYVEAELWGKQGRLGEAKAELNTAERLDPTLKFASPQAIQELQARIAGTHPMMQQAQPMYQRQAVRSNGNGGMGTTILIVIGLIVLFFVIARALGRRNTVVAAGGYPAGSYPAYGPGMPPQPYGTPGMMGGQGGIGSGILGGLATGAAVGAGMVAGEELMHHFTDRDRNGVVYDTPPNNIVNTPDDMGGNDFGVSDSSSWDSGGGGGGSDDW